MSLNKTISCYNIKDISGWLVSVNNKSANISLPSLQRGFVWKPYQIETLWDSILRGYPVGSVLVSDNNEHKDLLDGQQRCTSIALAYYNPLQETETQVLNLKENLPYLWLDLKKVNGSKYGLKYGVRVLTKSHPWGYQLQDNRKTLSASDIRSSLEFFRGDEEISYTELPSKNINPWDSHCPVPLHVLLNTDTKCFDTWCDGVKKYINDNLLHIRTKYCVDKNKVDYSSLQTEDYKYIYNAVERAKKLLIPEIVLDKEQILETEDEHNNTESTLFIRLNSEGTRITGEELIYSLLKATYPELKQLVEDVGLQFIAPSRIINIVSRLTLMQVNNWKSFQSELTLTQFKKQLKNEEYRKALEENVFVLDKSSKLINYAVQVLSSANKDDKIPLIFIKEMINKSIDLFLVLVCYLNNNQNLELQEQLSIRNSYFKLLLFSVNKEHKKVARRLYNILIEKQGVSWSDAVTLLQDNNSAIALPLLHPEKYKNLLESFTSKFMEKKRHPLDKEFNLNFVKENLNDCSDIEDLLKLKGEEEDKQKIANYWLSFNNLLFWNKSLLILAQRKYFNNEFKDFMAFDGIQDTNKPWDWDHIYPNSWIYKKHNVSVFARWVVNCIGNFRALSFNKNRSENNHLSPAERFVIEKATESKIQEEIKIAKDESYISDNDLVYWSQLDENSKKLDEDKVEVFIKANFLRMINIYSNVYNLFKNPEN